MKTGKLWKALILAGIVGIAGGLAGCGGEKADKGASAAVSSNGKKIVKIAHTAHYFPYDYVDDKNQSDGMEVAVMKEVAKKLPRYEFQYVPTSDDDLLIGVESGKYDAGTKGIWKTPAREKKYIFPENNIAASVIGVTIRSEDADKIHSLKISPRQARSLCRLLRRMRSTRSSRISILLIRIPRSIWKRLKTSRSLMRTAGCLKDAMTDTFPSSWLTRKM